MSSVDRKPSLKPLAEAFSPYSISRGKSSSSHRRGPVDVWKVLPFLPEAPLSGLATRSTGFNRSFPPGSLSQLPTLWGFPLQSFSPSQGSKKGFPSLFRSCAFPQNPSGFDPALQRLMPLGKASSPCPRRISSGRKGALVGFGPLRLSLRPALRRSVSLPLSPSRS